jgi:hypothetical protein
MEEKMKVRMQKTKQEKGDGDFWLVLCGLAILVFGVMFIVSISQHPTCQDVCRSSVVKLCDVSDCRNQTMVEQNVIKCEQQECET